MHMEASTSQSPASSSGYEYPFALTSVQTFSLSNPLFLSLIFISIINDR